MYKIKLMPNAKRHLEFWAKSGQKKVLQKLEILMKELEEHPQNGIGQVEQLKGNMSGLWSRRLDKSSRLVYSIDENVKLVVIMSAKGHYSEI